MDKSALVRWFGYRAAFTHGDPLVLDRWLWLARRLPRTRNGERLIDVGCGTGAFTHAAALRGYGGIGLSWDRKNQEVATARAAMLGISGVSFPILDVRELGRCGEYREAFEAALCCETIEHVLDDLGLMRAIHDCLKPGGRLLLTAPNYYYRAITAADNGPFSRTEDGGHVRRGYTEAMLRELCRSSGFAVEELSYCSGFLSQKICRLWRALHHRPILNWAVTLPLRIAPLIFDRAIGAITRWPWYSICLVAYKPRFPQT